MTKHQEGVQSKCEKRSECEKAKKLLQDADRAVIKIDDFFEGEPLEVEIDAEKFEEETLASDGGEERAKAMLGLSGNLMGSLTRAATSIRPDKEAKDKLLCNF